MLYRKKEMHDGWVFRRGDIYLANLNPFRGSEQGGTRPVLVLQNNAGNLYAPTLIIAPITSQLHKLGQPTHYLIRKSELNGAVATNVRELDTQGRIEELSRILGGINVTDAQRAAACDMLKEKEIYNN